MKTERGGLPPELMDALADLPTSAGLAHALRLEGLCGRHPEHAARLRELAAEVLQLDAAIAAPRLVAGYRLGPLLGEGGMGRVYLAEQVVGVRRFVAFKMMKPPYDGPVFVAQFERERQLLALMQHDSIAKVFDCGVSAAGEPWFTMELVGGVPMDRYCRDRRVSLDDRIGLLVLVCDAMQHAHQKRVVHRDLKPSNVLVGDDDQGRPRVKIIDFGLAKVQAEGIAVAGPQTGGSVVGTVEYMPPEQARSGNADVDTRADVYSIGVMLYQLLVDELPIPSERLRGDAEERLEVLTRFEPERPSNRLARSPRREAVAASCGMTVGGLERRLRADLDWLVMRAIQKDREDRYPSVEGLAADLRRFLAGQPLSVGPPTKLYRWLKLVRRNRARITAVAALLALALFFMGREVVQAADLLRKTTEIARISIAPRCSEVVAAAAVLHPAVPERLPELDTWLATAAELLRQRPVVQEALADLRSRALPRVSQDRESDARLKPLLERRQRLATWIAALERAEAVRHGRADAVAPDLPPGEAQLAAGELDTKAWDRVALGDDPWRIRGQELLGLAYARAAVENARGTAGEVECLTTLAVALFTVGLDRESESVMQEAAVHLSNASSETGEWVAQERSKIALVGSKMAAYIAHVRDMAAELEPLIAERRAWRHEEPTEQFMADALRLAMYGLDDLAETNERIERRRRWAMWVRAATLSHPGARHTWEDARAAIARADGEVASRDYAGVQFDLREQNVMGLVPIGMNPQTRLWEFYDLRSAWDGQTDPLQLPIPLHRPDGSMEVAESTGVVFVLVPGGEYWMGAQSKDPAAPCYDRFAEHDETPIRVRLDPFWIARHELTRAQWLRLWDGEAAGASPSRNELGVRYSGDAVAVGPTHPVESVTWTMCNELVKPWGMAMPTEAQWEFACRGGTTTPWSTGRAVETLEGFANVSDAGANDSSHRGTPAAWSDHYTNPAPVGTFQPNGYGLFDMPGNVWEICQDAYASDPAACRDGDGLRAQPANGTCVGRGGSFQDPATAARSAARSRNEIGSTGNNIGFRPVRLMRR